MDESLIEQIRREHEAVFSPDSCPQHLRESLERYALHGIPTGDCLRAVLANDLMEAFCRADVETARSMAAIASYVWNRVPRDAWGSYGDVDAWISRHREARAAAQEARHG